MPPTSPVPSSRSLTDARSPSLAGIPYFKRKKAGSGDESKSAAPSRAHSRPASVAHSAHPNGGSESETVADALIAAKKARGRSASETPHHQHGKDVGAGGQARGDFARIQREALEAYLLGVLHAVVRPDQTSAFRFFGRPLADLAFAAPPRCTGPSRRT